MKHTFIPYLMKKKIFLSKSENSGNKERSSIIVLTIRQWKYHTSV